MEILLGLSHVVSAVIRSFMVYIVLRVALVILGARHSNIVPADRPDPCDIS